MDAELRELVSDVGAAARDLVDSATRDVRQDVADGMARLRRVEDEVRGLSARWDALKASQRAKVRPRDYEPVPMDQDVHTAYTIEVLTALTRLVQAIKVPA